MKAIYHNFSGDESNCTQIRSTPFFSNGSGGDVRIYADTVFLSDSTVWTDTSGNGYGGSISIKAYRLEVRNGAVIDTFTFGTGSGGDVRIAAYTVYLSSEESTVFTGIATLAGGSGNAGNITIRANHLEVRNGADIHTFTFDNGRGGNVLVDADTVLLSGDGAEFTTGIGTESKSNGDAGNITINTNHFEVRNGAEINTATFAEGRAGNVHVNTRSLLVDDQATITTTGFQGASAGSLNVVADQIRLNGVGSRIGADASTFLAANLEITLEIELGSDSSDINTSRDQLGVNLISPSGTIVPLFSLELPRGALKRDFSGTRFSDQAGSRIQADSSPFSGIFRPEESLAGLVGEPVNGSWTLEIIDGVTGEIGTLKSWSLKLGDLQLSSNVAVEFADSNSVSSTIIADAEAGALVEGLTLSGKSGDIHIITPSLLVLNGAAISSATLGSGDGGVISIEAQDIQLSNGATISAGSDGTGNAGTLSIVATNAFTSTDSSVTTETTQSNGGDITLKAGKLVHLIDSAITTSVGNGEGTGGNINIDPDFVILDSSRIQANAFGGTGGNITIVSDNFIASPDSVVDASSQLGIDGQVNITSPDADISNSLTPLSTPLLNIENNMQTPCAHRSGADVSRFVVKKYDALPDSPYALRAYLPALPPLGPLPIDILQPSSPWSGPAVVTNGCTELDRSPL